MIAIIDYGAGNIASVANALRALNQEFILTNSAREIEKADKVIFPGQGEASFAVKRLQETGLFELLQNCKKPVLGICLGLQLLADGSKEGNVNCIGIIPGINEKFDDKKTKVPHMGWNSITIVKQSKLLNEIKSGENFYFAHSYYLPLNDSATSTSENGITFTASVEKDNYYGVQFHPEKSGDAGLKILRNFIEIC